MPLREALQSAVAQLTAEHVPSPRLNAETLLMFTLNCDRAHLFAHPERELTAEEQSRYDEALTQRAKGVPAQYITGHQEFWGLDLIVSPAVLIPRPETEHLIDNAKAKIARKGCDWIVANDVSPALGVMGGDRNTVHLLTCDDANEIAVDSWPVMTKEQVAAELVARIAKTVEKNS
jgi:hypothetical protein